MPHASHSRSTLHIRKPPNAALHLPRIQPRNHPTLAHESRAIRGQVQAIVRGHCRRDAPPSLITFRRNEPHPNPRSVEHGAIRSDVTTVRSPAPCGSCLMSLSAAAERPASPAAHSTWLRPSLADESRAIRGRVHAVVRCGLDLGRVLSFARMPSGTHHVGCRLVCRSSARWNSLAVRD